MYKPDSRVRTLPSQITFAVIATGVIAVVPLLLVGIWTMARIDQQSLERERLLIENAIDQAIARVHYEQQSISIWDDAVVFTRQWDDVWMAENVGQWMYDYYGHEHAIVLNERDAPVHVMLDGATRPREDYAVVASLVAPQVAALRRQLAEGKDPAEANVTRVTLVDEVPAVVSAVAIVPSSERVTVEPGEEYVHVAVRLMDREFLAAIAEEQIIEDLRFEEPGPGLPRRWVQSDGAKPWLDHLAWTPATPGLDLVAGMAPVLGLSFAAFVTLASWLLVRLRRMAGALHDSEVQSKRLALHDVLTGLPNRALFNERLEEAIAMTRTGAGFALHYVDLDRFKHVNDTLGHPAGDQLIRQVGERISRLVGGGGTVARLGGDEFAVIQTGIIDSLDAEALATRMIEATRQPFTLGEDTAFVDASVGIAIAREARDTRSELMRKADIALYQAKSSGKGRHCVFEASLDEVVRQKRTIERDLRRALEDDIGLSIVYQPLFAIDGKNMVGAEALVRWDHPVFGPLAPPAFVGVAEERGLIHALGSWVLREACLTAKRLDLPWIAVNVSAVQFRDPGFVDTVLDLLGEIGLSPERLQLEITEGLLLDASKSVVDALTKLRFAGIRIALDDFGTGYSSLQYLHRYKVDKIKIDRSFVKMLGEGEQADAIVRAMVQLGSALDLQVTAEGVETAEQWHCLEAIGAPELQGFLFSRPVSADALMHLVRGDAGPEEVRRSA